MAALDEDTVDEILYLARANEGADLEAYLSEVSTKTKQSRSEILAAAVDQYSKNSALHYAAANGHSDIVSILFAPATEKPTSTVINALNDAGNTPLHWAALNGHLECVKILVQAGADVTIINKAGHDAVFEAEINDKQEVVDWLLGAVEDLETGIGQTGEGPSGDQVDEDMEDADGNSGTDKVTVGGESTAAASLVEAVRKQMEGLDAKDAQARSG